jgi:hypothetical protein
LTVPSGVARLSYFYGQLLTQRDLQVEQLYHVELRRLFQREAFGTGTVAGLLVEDAGATKQGAVFVRAGLALDPQGRELLLVNDQCITITVPPMAPANAHNVTGPNLADIAFQATVTWNAQIDPLDVYDQEFNNNPLWQHLVAVGLTELNTDVPPDLPALVIQLNQISVPNPPPLLKPGQLLRDFLFDTLVGTTYLGLQYVERGTDPSPTVLDASCCGNATCFPSRREEGVVLVAQDHPFHHEANPYHRALERISTAFAQTENPQTAPAQPPPQDCQKALCDLLLHAWRGLPPEDPCGTGHLPVVPIAVVYWARFQRAPGLSQILSIDNCSRPFAPGVPPVRALLDALVQCTAAKPTAPRLELISPRDHTQITVVTTATNSTATVTVRATCLLTNLNPPLPASAWWVFHYSPPPLPPGIGFYNANQQPSGYTITLTSSSVPSSNPTVTELQLVFASSSPNPNFLPSGTYRWQINIMSPPNSFKSLQTGVPVDGVLEGVFYVP